MTMITPSYLGETIEYSSLHACRSTLEDPTIATAAGLRNIGLAQWLSLTGQPPQMEQIATPGIKTIAKMERAPQTDQSRVA